jgi:hypothetical protein
MGCELLTFAFSWIPSEKEDLFPSKLLALSANAPPSTKLRDVLESGLKLPEWVLVSGR